ncbi:unnamed protein product [Protopolystoma xenopodis]|uniref:Uncharacterized protein n=1 Tax=Protopolystoma xenopodis TaxID=117903 RepID=A0A3S5C1N6_9PLAT|nr:unnamed protein product [Protopolystoma xenopodis]
MVRTKSGRLIEKIVMLTEAEYKAFEATGGDLSVLQRLGGLAQGEAIEAWEKASTLYDGSEDDEDFLQGSCIMAF